MLAFFAQMSKPEISVTGDSSGFRAVPGHKGHSKSLVPWLSQCHCSCIIFDRRKILQLQQAQEFHNYLAIVKSHKCASLLKFRYFLVQLTQRTCLMNSLCCFSSSQCWTTARGFSPCSRSTRWLTSSDGCLERSTTSSSCRTASFPSRSSSPGSSSPSWPTPTSASSSSSGPGISGGLWLSWSWRQREDKRRLRQKLRRSRSEEARVPKTFSLDQRKTFKTSAKARVLKALSQSPLR